MTESTPAATLADASLRSTHIHVVGARVHNLKDVSVSIPLGQLTALTGVNGAGKTSLAIETIHAESQRRYLETLSPATRLYLNPAERPDVERIENLPPAILIQADTPSPRQLTSVAELTETYDPLATLATLWGDIYCPACQIPVRRDSIPALQQELAALPDGIRLQLVIPVSRDRLDSHGWPAEKQRWQAAGLDRFLELNSAETAGSEISRLRETVAFVIVDRLTTGQSSSARIAESLEQTLSLGDQQAALLIDASAFSETAVPDVIDAGQRGWKIRWISTARRCPGCAAHLPDPEWSLLRRFSAQGGCPLCAGTGLVAGKPRQPSRRCPECSGLGLNPIARNLRLPMSLPDRPETPVSLAQLLESRVDTLHNMLSRALAGGTQGPSPVRETLNALTDRLAILTQLGLSSLALSRPTRSLSRSEIQRCRLAAAIGSRFVQTLYVFDEPGYGLGAADCAPVLHELRRLRDQGNTVVIVEHQRELIEGADHIIDLGPGAGQQGGEVLYTGTVAGLKNCPTSRTGQALAGTLTAAVEHSPTVPSPKSDPAALLQLIGVTFLHLPRRDLEFPLQQFSVVTGPSGSGKTAFVCDTLYPTLRELIPDGDPTDGDDDGFRLHGQVKRCAGWEGIDQTLLIDDSDPGFSSRSTPVTYLKAYDEIRRLLAETVDGQTRGYTPSQFSFNTSHGGRCANCNGTGATELDLQFLASVRVRCPECLGRRFTRETLEVKFRQRNVAEILQMSAEEAFTFFRHQPALQRRLQSLRDVGLGYLSLGQATSQLSRGERQRLKLASYLTAASGKHVLYLFDDPAAGLHPADVLTLCDCLRRLVEQGHTVIATGCDPILIAAAGHVIELTGG